MFAFKASAGMPSGPADFPFLSWMIALRISSLVGGGGGGGAQSIGRSSVAGCMSGGSGGSGLFSGPR